MITLLDDVAYSDRLTPSEAILLRHLLDNSPYATPARSFYDVLYGHLECGGAESNTVQVFLARLRTKLRLGFWVETVGHGGYRLCVEPETLERIVLDRVSEALSTAA